MQNGRVAFNMQKAPLTSEPQVLKAIAEYMSSSLSNNEQSFYLKSIDYIFSVAVDPKILQIMMNNCHQFRNFFQAQNVKMQEDF